MRSLASISNPTVIIPTVCCPLIETHQTQVGFNLIEGKEEGIGENKEELSKGIWEEKEAYGDV